MVTSKKEKKRRKQTRIERARAGYFRCQTCGKPFGLSDKHHKECNSCWRKSHPHQEYINEMKRQGY